MSAPSWPAVVTYFEPQPAPEDVPTQLASPFAPGPPHPLAHRAARELQGRLRRGDVTGFDPGDLEGPGGGKMFGVLVVATPDGRIGYLQGFSGMLGGRWWVEGFAPPLFDPVARDTFWPAGEAELGALERLHAELREPDARRAEVARQRAEVSRRLWRRLSETYVLPNARGERQSLGALFAPEPPPGGAGDCAAPKLFGQAYAHHLRPLALAEFWWGAPPPTGERHAGEYFPACQSKCGRVLPYMLEGLPVEPAPLACGAPMPEEAPRVVFEDPWLLVLDKPRGLPSIPSRHDRLRDSVLVRLQGRGPDTATPLVVNALDAEVSGLLLVAKDPETRAALHRLFARREAEVRFVAWVEGSVAGAHGVLDLPLRAEPEAPLRHAVDPVHGRRALSEWRVTQRTGGRTRVVFVPHGRVTHPLRVLAAHPLGLGAPIVGDALYGRDDTRLMLHAESLTFPHPRTGERLDLESPAPF